MFENPKRGRQARHFTKKCSENSRSQIVFPTDIFRKLTLGAPILCLLMRIIVLILASLGRFGRSYVQRFLNPEVVPTSGGLTSIHWDFTFKGLNYIRGSHIQGSYIHLRPGLLHQEALRQEVLHPGDLYPRDLGPGVLRFHPGVLHPGVLQQQQQQQHKLYLRDYNYVVTVLQKYCVLHPGVLGPEVLRLGVLRSRVLRSVWFLTFKGLTSSCLTSRGLTLRGDIFGDSYILRILS